jgi:hypothetical protein
VEQLHPQVEARNDQDSAHAVFIVWEKLRILYNAVLVLITLGVGFPHLADSRFWAQSVAGAVAANICYCLGPCLEGYLSLLGWPRAGARWFVFMVGTLLAAFLAAVLTFGFMESFVWKVHTQSFPGCRASLPTLQYRRIVRIDRGLGRETRPSASFSSPSSTQRGVACESWWAFSGWFSSSSSAGSCG